MSLRKCFFSLAALACFGLTVHLLSSTESARTQAQPPGKEQDANRLKELLNERATVTKKALQQVAVRVKTGNAAIDELFEPTRLALEAALDACDNEKARLNVLQEYLIAAKENERIATQFVKSGQGRDSTALAATAERLRIEIALERAKMPQGKAPKGDLQKAAIKANSLELVGSIEAYESVRAFSRVTGVLKEQRVGLGDRVKRGQVLAVLDAPELEAQTVQDAVTFEQARARVNQAKASVQVALANLETAKAGVVHAEAAEKASATLVQFRDKQWKRIQDLAAQKAVEESIVNEHKEHLDSAVAANHAARAAVTAAKSQVASNAGKVAQAEADVVAAEADVRMAQLKLDASRQRLALTTIIAPFDGVITQRNRTVGELVRSADVEPIMNVQRTDLMRVITSAPEQDVPRIAVGDAVEVNIAAFAGKKFAAKISRTGVALDPSTRTMRVEIDLHNPDGRIRAGMFARVSIATEK